jgi:hypothetical protein
MSIFSIHGNSAEAHELNENAPNAKDENDEEDQDSEKKSNERVSPVLPDVYTAFSRISLPDKRPVFVFAENPVHAYTVSGTVCTQSNGISTVPIGISSINKNPKN